MDWFSGVNDDTWLWMHTSRRLKRRPEIANLLPGLPAPSLQENYTGSSAFATLQEGFNAYRLFERYYETYIGPIADCRGILDFGCGWGRIIRFFWGEACIPKAYVEKHWTEIFDICDYMDDGSVCPQNVIVARKRM